MNEGTKVCSNHFELGRPVESHPDPTLFLKGYDREENTRKRKAPRVRLPVPPKATKARKSQNSKKEMNRDAGNKLNAEQDVQNDSTVNSL